jgi:ethanolamine utilization protein EutA
LPLRNLPVVLPGLSLAPDDLRAEIVERALLDALDLYRAGGAGMPSFGMAIRWEGSPTLQRLDTVAGAILKALGPHLKEAAPCVVIVDGDVAGLLGSLLDRRYHGARPVICLDGVHIHEFDHIDIGEFEQQSRALPVVVKSLLFVQSPGHTHVKH